MNQGWVREGSAVADKQATVLMMAAGTGGHVFPALAIADRLQEMGVCVNWLGTRAGMERELVGSTRYTYFSIDVSGLVGSGIRRKILAPFMLISSLVQAMGILRKSRPNCVLGMGGYVCGPGGIAARLLGIPLLLHEQNAVAGLTNRLLARIADRVCAAFPGDWQRRTGAIVTGNPVRAEIALLNSSPRTWSPERPLRLLVLGGSQGARAINLSLPGLLKSWPLDSLPVVVHQTGEATFEQTKQAYQDAGIDLARGIEIKPFIEDMAEAYAQADLAICRAGASTVTELAAASLPAILVPYPYHKDNQQLLNATWLADGGAAEILEQQNLSAESLGSLLERVANPERLSRMSEQARNLAILDADQRVAEYCMEYIDA